MKSIFPYGDVYERVDGTEYKALKLPVQDISEHRKSCRSLKVRSLLPESPAVVVRMSKDIYYSDKYEDDKFEYRHVMLPKVDLALTTWFY